MCADAVWAQYSFSMGAACMKGFVSQITLKWSVFALAWYDTSLILQGPIHRGKHCDLAEFLIEAQKNKKAKNRRKW
jgi:hypothetical protein